MKILLSTYLLLQRKGKRESWTKVMGTGVMDEELKPCTPNTSGNIGGFLISKICFEVWRVLCKRPFNKCSKNIIKPSTFTLPDHLPWKGRGLIWNHCTLSQPIWSSSLLILFFVNFPSPLFFYFTLLPDSVGQFPWPNKLNEWWPLLIVCDTYYVEIY